MNPMIITLAVPAIERVIIAGGIVACTYLVGKIIDKCDDIKLNMSIPGGFNFAAEGYCRGN